MKFNVLTLISLLAFLFAPVSSTPHPHPGPDYRLGSSPDGLRYNLYPLERRNADPEPQGVYDLIAPKGSHPLGCAATVPYRFSMIPLSVRGGPPKGPMHTVCDAPERAVMRLNNSILTDRQGRIGSIVANRQFQFDGPPAQAGAIFTAGFSICNDDSTLALGPSKIFYRCLSGTFFNLYDRAIGGQCDPVYLQIAHVVQC